MSTDEKWMRYALREAEIAREEGEIPVGAVVIKDREIIATGHNMRERTNSPSGHAEMIALERASAYLGSWKLDGCTLYVTLEPCVMCAGACIQARLDRVVFGAYDRDAGCMGSIADLTVLPLGRRPDVFGGVLEAECRQILQSFFEDLRR